MNEAGFRPWLWLAGITGLTTVLVLAGRTVMPWEKMFPDYITYWTAGKLVASGQSPYDVDRQFQIQRNLGGTDRSMAGGSSVSCPIIILPGSRWAARCSSPWDSRGARWPGSFSTSSCSS